MFKLDFTFRQKLIDAISDFSQRKHLNESQRSHCLILRHIVLKTEHHEQKLSGSLALAQAIEQYCNLHLTSRFLGIRRSSKLKKLLFCVIQNELVDAVTRENHQLRKMIQDSQGAGRLMQLSVENQEYKEQLSQMIERARQAEQLTILQQDKIQKLTIENKQLQIQLYRALGRINSLENQFSGFQSRLKNVERQQSASLPGFLNEDFPPFETQSKFSDIEI